MTDCWVKSTWEFVSKHNIQLYNPNYVLPPLQREGDEFIMERLTQMHCLLPDALIKVNRCWMQ